MPSAEILTIGTELLLGEIVDTNTQYLARQLREAGIDLFYTSTVGDNEGRIAEAVQHALTRSQILLCTGGLGPTVDDVTREGIAGALGVELEFKDELWKQIQERFARFGRTPTENNKRQAYLPQGAQILENAVGTAPAFLIERNDSVVISMPGVPGEMAYILEHGVFPYLEKRFGRGAVIRTRILHIAGVGESQIDEKIADLEKLPNPTVGLSAHPGTVDVRLTAKAASPERAKEMLAELEVQTRQRLGDWVYGTDEETLARAVLEETAVRKRKLAVIEKGLEGLVIKALTGQGNAFVGGEILNVGVKTQPLKDLARQYAKEVSADVVLGVELRAGAKKHELEISIEGLSHEHHYTLSFGGHILQAPEWAVNLALSVLRRELLKESSTV
ncbi:MAG: CinA family nicotinamide mononucleotide deamidase-related protein [Chloroflexi bacterium]|nr:CinA family nicotinamide mononucleotide deamidase-related protein [Chloroflexota bacterium]